MIRCPSCGEENPERARFCLNCATPLASAPTAAGEVRKTVTVLFADIVSSTSRGEQTDPESTRRMLARYFDAMRGVVERHGGTVEKFIGDAVMAVFGIPTLHEDDALRAVRAADGLRAAVDRLNQQVAGAGWAPIALRIGVNTGEVVAGDPAGSQTLVTGDAVNVAARLEQAAGSGEVLLGATTYRLVRDAITAGPMPPLELKGKAEPVEAFRLVSVGEGGPMRRHDTPLVGRQRELRLLNEAFERANEEQACHLFTLLGTAGVGKSRLVHEFLSGMHDHAHVLRARCLPYGEGITFWPVIELVQAAAGIEMNESPESARRKVEELLAAAPERDAIIERVSATIGLSKEVVPTEEAFWGVRKILEAIASAKPLIVVIDDLHWAEPTMLDLVDHIADWSREAPILLLVIARPELLEARPQWGGGKMNATTILLEPLGADDSAKLIANLVNDASLAQTVQRRIGETAEGNPLFVEELVAMLVDQGVLRRQNGGWQAVQDLAMISVPPSISALVAARLDHLEPLERDLIGRASVVGKIFQRSAVAELSPPERRGDLGPRLMTLVRKELVRPDRSGTTGDEAFRFRHLLVRDAAYASLTKEQRADLHARFATWLEAIAGERLLEYEEVIAYHLEQAHRYRSELGLADELTTSLRDRASARLQAAGMRASGRHDLPASVNLLTRAAALIDDDRRRAEVLLHVADSTVLVGDLTGGLKLYAEISALAAGAGDDLVALRAELESIHWEMMANPHVDENRFLVLADRVETLAAERGDKWGRIAAELARSAIFLNHCRWMDNLAALERAKALMEPDEDPRLWNYVNGFIWNSLNWGPVPAPEAISRIESDAAQFDAQRAAEVLSHAAGMLAMQGRFDEAREWIEGGRVYLQERGLRLRVGGYPLRSGQVETVAGDLEAADREYADGIDILQDIGETGVLSTLASLRSEILYRLGRREEMEKAIELARESGAANDIATQAQWRWVAAMAAADDGRASEAERLVTEALEEVEPTDYRELRAGAFEALAHVEARAGRPGGWKAALERALSEHEQKGNIVMAARVRDQLAGHPPSPAGASHVGTALA